MSIKSARLLVAVALAATAAVPASAAVAAPTSAPPTEAVAAPVWGECPPPAPGFPRDSRMRCATLRVPLDYSRPGGRKIDVAVSRIDTSVPGQRRGILLSNPGGPGGTGLDLPSILALVMPPEVLAQYDLIGFDPRGIGRSTPITCGFGATPDVTLVLPYPAPDGSIARNVAFARATAASCAAHSGDLLPFITTANTARDMDRIRQALGEPKLSYFGLSYGTYLGAVFTTLFPHRSDRILLDSAVDPRIVWRDMWRTWHEAVALRFPDFLTFAAAQDATYGLGATPAEVRATWNRITATLDREPLVIPDVVTIDGNYVREATRSILYNDSDLPVLAQFLQEILAVIEGAPLPLASLGAMLDVVQGWAGAAAADVPVDNQLAALYAVVCDDAQWPGNIARHQRDVDRSRRVFPVTAGMPSNLWPCAFWPTEPREAPVRVTDRGPRNVLILQNTRDPATSLRSALGLRAALGRRAAMVTVNQGGHGTYFFGSCADEIANTFLATGALPVRDRFCQGNPVPTGQQRAATTGLRVPRGPL
jgi:pimeloyl-ACP methyl ester carboxylesterase